jgi:CheY-like chemotaxis protein
VKFTSRGGVELALRRDRAGLIYSVKDSGPGIAVDQQQSLFQRYAQTEGGRRAGGSGLGLAICRELAELMHGRVELDSAPGQGSEFRLVLPLEVSAEPLAAVRSDTSGAALTVTGAATRTLSLLLVEDDPNAAATLCGLLELLGHRVRHVPQGLAALADLEQGSFDAVLCDLDLPGLDGLALVRTWRKREAQRSSAQIPFIALTARTEPDIESRVFAAGMQAFQRKPVTSVMLAEVLAPSSPQATRVAAPRPKPTSRARRKVVLCLLMARKLPGIAASRRALPTSAGKTAHGGVSGRAPPVARAAAQPATGARRTNGRSRITRPAVPCPDLRVRAHTITGAP